MSSLGGKIRGKAEREIALKKYYNNPNICMYCGKIIEVPENKKVSEIRKKKFCNSSCSAKYNNKKRNNNKYYCNLCGIEIKSSRAKYCDKCRLEYKSILLGKKTKGELIKEKGYSSARSIICKNARKVYYDNNKNYKCEICGYDKYLEVCHIKAVKDFLDSDKIEDINNINNLIGLCPNHHKEYDNKILKL